ncbi:LacI family DNA-binding transcriptional regulator [Gluconobacter cerinus]|uniref:LacI family DNA-binding transcriptional regulator n=1 Tax=Gluconobacter cerinus TaxID=38307 RepID=UPI003098DC46
MNRRVKLSDISKKTGLNVSTISRALSNPERVSEETRHLVQEVASQLGYVGNAAARNLILGKTDTIMVLIPTFPGQPISPVFTEVLRGICEEAEAHGLSVMLQQNLSQAISSDDATKFLRTGTVDGVLLLAAEKWTTPHAFRPREHVLPVISVLNDLTSYGLVSVVAEEKQAFSEIVDHLAARGHRHFAFVSGPRETTHEQIRFQATTSHLKRLGLLADLVRLEGGPFDLQSGKRAAQAFLKLKTRPTAVICCSDSLAFGFLHEVQNAGLKVPADVAIAGYDGLDYTAFTTPSLTTSSQPSSEMGCVAVRMLNDIWNKKILNPTLAALVPSLLVRQST